MGQNFSSLTILEAFPKVTWATRKYLGLIGSAVLSFFGYNKDIKQAIKVDTYVEHNLFKGTVSVISMSFVSGFKKSESFIRTDPTLWYYSWKRGF